MNPKPTDEAEVVTAETDKSQKPELKALSPGAVELIRQVNSSVRRLLAAKRRIQKGENLGPERSNEIRALAKSSGNWNL